MKKLCKRAAAFFVVILFICALFPVRGQAADNKDAKKAFLDFLNQKSITWSDTRFAKSAFRFKYYEIGKGKIPVLVVKNKKAFPSQGICGIYQHIDGAVTRVAVYDQLENVYVKSGVFVFAGKGKYGGVKRYYYKLNGRKLKKIAYSAVLDEKRMGISASWCRKMFGKDVYQWDKKKVSRKTFDKKLKKQVKGSRKEKPGTLYKNNASNRKKYLKG